MGGSHAVTAQERAGDDDERLQELDALDDYQATLALIRGAIPRAGESADALNRALWRMAEDIQAIRDLADRRVAVRRVADQAVASYQASQAGRGHAGRGQRPALSVVRPT